MSLDLIVMSGWQIVEMSLAAFWKFVSFEVSFDLHVSELYSALCVTLAPCELTSDVRFCTSLFALLPHVLSFTSSWGIGFWFELSICTWSVLSPFCLFLRDHVLCLSCVELLSIPLGLRLFISRDLVSAFSHGFWISWMSFFFFFLC